ncbi:MAG: hypothetical protein HAW67_00450, partial [Endozoicomonadaceae bacterium]|nr:hypothetical protein [Endozoicomonadaceae bacterium]
MHTIRRNNLQELVRKYDTKEALAKAIDKLPSQISQTTNKRKDGSYFRNVGENFARTVEKKLDLPNMWMDIDHEPTNENGEEKTSLSPYHLIVISKMDKLSKQGKEKVMSMIDDQILIERA